MSQDAMRLKAQINHYAKQHAIAAQTVLQNFMFERFLERVSLSKYKNHFVIKGGVLIATLVGLDNRSTMDLDTTVLNFPLNQENILTMVEEICQIDIKDGVIFRAFTFDEIRGQDVYGGWRIKFHALYDNIDTPLSIDITTGDKITPAPMEYAFPCLFDAKKAITLLGYNIETILAEKVETILVRGELNTRPRDFYDVYILTTSKGYNKTAFLEALKKTAKHRGSANKLTDISGILSSIQSSSSLKNQWKKYQHSFPYARHINYDMLVWCLNKLFEIKK